MTTAQSIHQEDFPGFDPRRLRANPDIAACTWDTAATKVMKIHEELTGWFP